MRGVYFVLVILAALLLFFGCGDKGNPAVGGNDDLSAINWVGTDKVYSDSADKKQCSFIFFYADWCGWCKKMEKETFSDTAVVRIINESFNAVRINGESDTLVVYRDSALSCRGMVEYYGITGYPTTCFFKGAGQYIIPVLGYKSAQVFRQILDTILTAK